MFGATKLGGRKLLRLAPWLCAAGGVMCGAAMPARADHTCGPQCRRVWVAPVYEKRSRIVVTAAKYEDVVRRVWREAVYEERRVLTKVPAEFRWVERPVYDRYGRVIGYERVEELVRPAYDRWEVHKILICPGRWEEIRERVLPLMPDPVRRYYERERPIELRPVEFAHYLGRKSTTGRFNVWIRTTGPLPDDAMRKRMIELVEDLPAS